MECKPIKLLDFRSTIRYVEIRGLDWTCKTQTELKFVKRGLDSNL